MTSIEISELTCKLHKNVVLIEMKYKSLKMQRYSLGQPAQIPKLAGRTLPELSRDGVMMLAMKYDTVIRYKITQK